MFNIHQKKYPIIKGILDINDASFFWYIVVLAMYFILYSRIGETLDVHGISRLELIGFVSVSGGLKFFYRIDAIVSWLHRSYGEMKDGKLLVRNIARIILFSEKYVLYLHKHVLKGGALEVALSSTITAVFSWTLILYFSLQIVERFYIGWVEEYMHMSMDTILLFALLVGALAIYVDKDEREAGCRFGLFKKRKKHHYVIDALLASGLALVASVIVYWKFVDLHVFGLVISIQTGILVLCISLILLFDDIYA